MAQPARYIWDRNIRRYRDRSTGRLVPEATVRRYMETVLRGDEPRARALAQAARAGRISRTQWSREMRELILEVHLYQTAAALGGWRAMHERGGRGYVLARAAADRQYREWFDAFALEVEVGTLPLDGRFEQRSLQYVRAGRHTFAAVTGEVQRDAGMTEERNVEDLEAAHCVGVGSCPEQTARGWVPIGTLIPIGERLCIVECKCHLAYRKGEVRFLESELDAESEEVPEQESVPATPVTPDNRETRG